MFDSFSILIYQAVVISQQQLRAAALCHCVPPVNSVGKFHRLAIL